MRRLQAGLFPEARRRMGKCLDWGAEGAAGAVAGAEGFLVVAGACAEVLGMARIAVTATRMMDRAFSSMRSDESPRSEDTAWDRMAQTAIRVEARNRTEKKNRRRHGLR